MTGQGVFAENVGNMSIEQFHSINAWVLGSGIARRFLTAQALTFNAHGCPLFILKLCSFLKSNSFINPLTFQNLFLILDDLN